MPEAAHVLISLEQRHAENILSGSKHVELRRRRMKIASGTIVWFYVKKPVGSVVGYACVADSHLHSPLTLWRRFSAVSGLTRQEFFSYFSGRSKGFALSLVGVERLDAPVSLEALRKVSATFHPPQFFLRMPADSRVLRALQKADRVPLAA